MLRFAEFELNLSERTLTRNGNPVALTPKAFDLLIELAGGAPRLLSKEYLLSKVWPDTFISEATLAQNIHAIRSALEIPGAIVTVPKSGYRFSLAVERTAPLEEQANVAPIAAARQTRLRWLAAAVVLIVAAAVVAKVGASAAAYHKADKLAQEGLVLMRRTDHAGLVRATANFREALEADPRNALATAGQAEASRRQGYRSPAYRLDLAERAVRLDPNCSECHGILGFLLMTDNWAWERAAQELGTAIKQNPESFQLRIWQSELFAATGKGEQSVSAAREAIRLAPERANPYVMLAGALYLNGRYEQATEEYRKALAITPDMPAALGWQYQTLLMQKNYVEGMQVRLRADGNYMGYSNDTLQKLLAESDERWSRLGMAGYLRFRLEEYSPPEVANHHRYHRAIWSMLLGDRDHALDELEAAIEQRSFELIYVKLDPIFGPLHGTARFEAILRKMGLPA
ncbi:MAG: winged helix-turn-helix domain-containing protein [Acidobacteriota bacterium]